MTPRLHFFIFMLYSLGAVVLAFWLPEFVPSVSRILGAIAGGFVIMVGGLVRIRRPRPAAAAACRPGRWPTSTACWAISSGTSASSEDDMLQLRATLANLASAPGARCRAMSSTR